MNTQNRFILCCDQRYISYFIFTQWHLLQGLAIFSWCCIFNLGDCVRISPQGTISTYFKCKRFNAGNPVVIQGNLLQALQAFECLKMQTIKR